MKGLGRLITVMNQITQIGVKSKSKDVQELTIRLYEALRMIETNMEKIEARLESK